MNENEIAREIVDASYRVHVTLGPGLLERVCEGALAHELVGRGLQTERQVSFPVVYDGVQLEEAFRADVLVEGKVIVEVKSLEKTAPVHKKQLITYLRIADLRSGLLINFGALRIKDGITRLVNGLDE